jgi:hypothetical protein
MEGLIVKNLKEMILKLAEWRRGGNNGQFSYSCFTATGEFLYEGNDC